MSEDLEEQLGKEAMIEAAIITLMCITAGLITYLLGFSISTVGIVFFAVFLTLIILTALLSKEVKYE